MTVALARHEVIWTLARMTLIKATPLLMRKIAIGFRLYGLMYPVKPVDDYDIQT